MRAEDVMRILTCGVLLASLLLAQNPYGRITG